jgi:hypothetical protein
MRRIQLDWPILRSYVDLVDVGKKIKRQIPTTMRQYPLLLRFSLLLFVLPFVVLVLPSKVDRN